MEYIERQAARLLVVTPEEQVLLLRLEPSFRDPFWVTPGGGLDDGEAFVDAARRELYEEVGREDLPIESSIWRRTVTFTWERWRVQQEEHTFVVETPGPFDAVTLHPDEEPITGSGWLTIPHLRALTEVVYPVGLADHLAQLFTNGVPAEPILLGDVVED